MINFKLIELKDKEFMESLVQGTNIRSFEYVFTNQWAWIDSYKSEIAEVAGCFTSRDSQAGHTCYLCPIGGDEKAAVLALETEAERKGEQLCIIAVNPKSKKNYEKWFPGCFEYKEDRDSRDYVYSVDKLADLKGKKLHAKRNHINKFMSLYPDWSFEPMDESNKHECLETASLWGEERPDDERSQGLGDERLAVERCIENFDYLGLEGGILRVGGKLIAMAIGEPINDSDSYDIHFEKADTSYEGSFTMINREFSRWIRDAHPELKYINREEDLGIEGLRKSKLSYHPDKLLDKYVAVQKAPLKR